MKKKKEQFSRLP
jgi:hypothetical protein